MDERTDSGVVEHLDVLIVGAGLSGIGAGYRLSVSSPWANFRIYEARDAIGGTWDLFRYPGIRSDSDMFSFGYSLRPWDRDDSIGQGADIKRYIEETARESGVDKRITFGHKVLSANWSTQEARWHATVQEVATGETSTVTANYLHSCTGYYRYDQGYTPDFAGMDDYAGTLIHPQQWPEDLDYEDKRIVVIGSGATAITLLPNLADKAANVTLLQRTPSYVMALPGSSPIAPLARKIPGGVGDRALRTIYALGSQLLFDSCRRWPERSRERLVGLMTKMLPEGFDVDTHFNPPYDPWDQRLCLSPDGDFFKAIRSGKADVVTDTIDTFTPAGLRLDSGDEIEADIIVTATGLEMLFIGGIQITVDGEEVDPNTRMLYRAMMLEGVPNFSYVFGYVNASWTLRADLSNEYLSQLLNEMRRQDFAQATPTNNDPAIAAETEPLLTLSSGYLQRAAHKFPLQGPRRPWRMEQRWWSDRRELKRFATIDDGMELSQPRAELEAGRRTKSAAS